MVFLPTVMVLMPFSSLTAMLSHLFQKFPQFIVIDAVKGFVVVNKAEVDVFLECVYVNLKLLIHVPPFLFGNHVFYVYRSISVL